MTTGNDPAYVHRDERRKVSRETAHAIERYVGLISTWNPRVNLISTSGFGAEFYERHIYDSMAVANYIMAAPGRVIDMGSGAGLPGVVIALVTGLHVDLIEADRRKAAFLQTAVAVLEIDATVWSSRVEHCLVAPARWVTARALTRLPKLLEFASRLIEPGGAALFLKGQQAQSEITDAQRDWAFDFTTLPGATDADFVLRIDDLRPRSPDDRTG